MSTAALLTDIETCPRAGYWAARWERKRLDGSEMLRRALEAAVLAPADTDHGALAAETVMELAATRGLATRAQAVYDCAVHHAALAEVLAWAVRPAGAPAWQRAGEVDGWTSEALLSPIGGTLRRFCLVTSWSDERQFAETRAWSTSGEMAFHGLPLQLVVLVLGQSREGKRHGPFTKGYLHPQNGALRFRRRGRGAADGFNARWQQVRREDVGGSIEPRAWLQAMLADDILRDVCFTVEVPLPEPQACDRVRDLARERLMEARGRASLPPMNLSTCWWPTPCRFQPECHGGMEPNRSRFFTADPLP